MTPAGMEPKVEPRTRGKERQAYSGHLQIGWQLTWVQSAAKIEFALSARCGMTPAGMEPKVEPRTRGKERNRRSFDSSVQTRHACAQDDKQELDEFQAKKDCIRMLSITL